MKVNEILNEHLVIKRLLIHPVLTEKDGFQCKMCDELLIISPANKCKFTVMDHLIWIPLCKLHYGLTKKWKFIIQSNQEQYRCILGQTITELYF